MFNIFGGGYHKEGPGVYKDTPRKKGIGRFIEVLGRDMTSFWIAGAIAAAAYIPGVLSVIVAIMEKNAFWTLVFGLVGGALGGPFYACVFDTVLRSLRDEPGYFWVRYRKAFKNNWKGALLPGAVFGMLVAMQALALIVFYPMQGDIFFLAGLFISVLVTLFFSTWYFPQLVLFQMSPLQMIRNSAILGFSKLPRTLGAAIFMGGYYFAAILFIPLSTLVMLLTSFWFPVLLAMLCIYRDLDATFELEKRMNEKREADLEAVH